MSCRAALLALVAVSVAGARSLADADSGEADARLLREAGVATTRDSLLDLLRKRTLGESDQRRVEKLIEQLGSDDFQEREKASAELVAFGPAVRPLLRQALLEPDLEVQRRAERCLQRIEHQSSLPVLQAAVRLVGRRRLEGADAVLLDLVPFVEDEETVEEVVRSLAAVALTDGKPSAALVAGVQSRQSCKRAAAAEALCRADGAGRPLGRHLLHDPDPLVRHRVALTLLEVRDRRSLPAMIALLSELPRAEAGTVEDRLRQVAGEESPEGDLDGDAEARRKYREKWQAWWRKREATLDLAHIDLQERLLGYTLISQLDLRSRQGRIIELDRHGKECHRIDGLEYPVDAQVIRGGRVLVCDYRAGEVTERNWKGDVLWEKRVPALPLAAQRLASGHTFIATRGLLLEVDARGKEVWSCRPPFPVTTARRLSDGQVAALTNNGLLVRLDRAGNVRKQIPVGPVHPVGTTLQVLPNGHILLPMYSQGKVVEYDAEGKEVWSAAVRRPFCAQRLSDGTTLVSSRLSLRIFELDRKGRILRTHDCEGWPLLVHRR
jgi:hypothetical protein